MPDSLAEWPLFPGLTRPVKVLYTQTLVTLLFPLYQIEERSGKYGKIQND